MSSSSNGIAQGLRLTIESAVPCGLALNELLMNAIEHAFPEGWQGERRIAIQMERGEGSYSLIVSDTGRGMPPDFDLERTSSLGLQIARTVVEQLRGSIVLLPGPGARFRIEFPDA